MNATQLKAHPATSPLFLPARVIQRVQEKATLDPATGCLISTYSVGSHGYAQIGWNEGGERIVTLAHRVVWSSHNGPIEPGMTVDHICKTKKCVNIEHLRLLSNFENARRTSGRDWPIGQCINGHANAFLTRLSDGKTGCFICAKYYWKKTKPKPLLIKKPKPKPVKVPRPPKTHCKNGHEWIPENFYTRPSGRHECLPCKQAHARRWFGYSTAA